MADRLAGYAPAVTITNNGSGKCRVTFPAFLVDASVYGWILTDGSHYIYNTTRSATSAISAKGGTESTGYYFDIALDFAGATWVTTDLAFPIRGSTGTSYSLVTLAHAGASDGDTILMLYGDTTKGFINLSAGIAWTKTVTLHGGFAKRRCILRSGTTNNLTAAKTVTYRNIHCQNPTAGAALYTGTANANIVADKCVFSGVNGVYIDSTATGGTATITNCIGLQISTNFSTCAGGTMVAYNNTLFACATGFNRSGGTMTASNNITHSCDTEYTGTIGGSNNYDQKAQAPATGRGLLNDATAKFLRDQFPGHSYDYRVSTASILLGAGVDVGLTEDIDGKAVSGSFPVGCSNGAMDPAYVLASATPAGTFDESARNTDPGIANVKAPTAYKIQNVSLAGTYSAGLTPDAPAVSAVSVGDGTVTVHVTLNSSDDPAYLVWTAFGRSANWTTPSESYKVTADGDITVSGLTNYREYAFAAISKSGGVYSQHSDTMVIEVPRPTTSDVSVRMRDQIAGATTQMLQRSGCGTVVYFREYPGADLVTLWASIDEGGSVQQLMRRGETDVETMSMTIPRQTDFPPSAGFKPGCEIHVGSVVYEVDTVQPDRATVDLASSFKISVFRHVHF